jgi:hypothetical protein
MATRGLRRGWALPAVALAGGLTVFVVATVLFAHHSVNHDEGVYLQQAELLLSGRLWLRSEVPAAVRPWFFVQDGQRLYPKYSPVTSALFAPGIALGVPRLILGLVAAAAVWLTGRLARAATDARTGLLAAGLVVTAPLFLLTGATFLSYWPTHVLSLTFALAYVLAIRRPRPAWGALAGVAIGLAFFARPFTAVLFALPFVAHALWLLVDAAPAADRLRDRLRLVGPVAVAGLGGVVLTLAYNDIVTGSALVFPYQAFAPQDGIGFGTRRILGYERQYTPGLALEANARVLWQLLRSWGPLAPVGSLAALLGLGTLARRLRTRGLGSPQRLPDRQLQALLAGVLGSVAVGNVVFWGNLNILAALAEPNDGLIALLGPYYHIDAVLPLSVFAAIGFRRAWHRSTAARQRLAAVLPASVGPGRVALALLVLAVPVAVGVEAAALQAPVEQNRQYTDRYDAAYEPFAERSLEAALVFVPTPYGNWLNHPFQSLRNDPDFGGDVVYALDRGPADNREVRATFPDRQPYRYTYRGAWTPDASGPVTATLRPLSVHRDDSHTISVRLGQVASAESATARLAGADRVAHYQVSRLSGAELVVTLSIDGSTASLTGPNLRSISNERDAAGDPSVELAGNDPLVLTVSFLQAGGGSVTYRVALEAHPTADGTALVWPPRTGVCALEPDCGHAGLVFPGVESDIAGAQVNVTRVG